MSDATRIGVERESAALVQDLDRLIAMARDHEFVSMRADRAHGSCSDEARQQRQRAREVREAAQATRHKAVALTAETRALIDQAECAGIDWRQWPRSTDPSDDLIGREASIPHPASVPHTVPAEHPALVRAVAFVAAHAGEPIDIADLVDAAGVGTRHLQGLFQRHHQVTPMAYLRRVRLDYAHADLCRADSTRGTTVDQIARRWQFTHLGRFAAAYRDRFGCVPRRTLRTMPAEPNTPPGPQERVPS